MSIIDRVFIQIVTAIQNLKSEEEGQGMVEYGLILALIAVVCITAFTLLGTKISAQITTVANAL